MDKKIKFREITLASGTKLLLGKDAETNDALMKKFREKSNIILHTVAPGSPFGVIEKINPSIGDITASGAIIASYSQDWRDNKSNVLVNVFTGRDISKPKDLKTGTWKVRKSKTITIKKKDIEELEK